MNFLGGKTKTGAILLAVGVAIYQTVDLCPLPAMVPWIKYIGSLVAAAGGALGLVGIGGKVDKAAEAVQQGQAGPAPLTEEGLKRLLAEAKAKKQV
jgi:hypothetical protein